MDGTPAAMMKSSLMTLAIALGANVGLFWIIVLIWENADFAALLTGLGSIAAVIGICHGTASSWTTESTKFGEQLANAQSISRRATIGGWLLSACSLTLLVVSQPTGWAAWMYGLAWGVLGGATFAITFTVIGGRLRRQQQG